MRRFAKFFSARPRTSTACGAFFGLSSAPIRLTAIVAVSAAGALARDARAQWTVVNLHPAEGVQSFAYGVTGDNEAGYTSCQGACYFYHGAVWSGSAASWFDLSTVSPGVVQSVNAATNGLVGGQNGSHAVIWDISAHSSVDLNPVGHVTSTVNAMAGQREGGSMFVTNNDPEHACIWSGTPGSVVDLQPLVTNVSYSRVYGMDEQHQVGATWYSSYAHAALWTGTAASWVDLYPALAGAENSLAYGVSAGQQAGVLIGYFGTNDTTHACVWRGTAASCVDINPVGATDSWAYGTSLGRQVGYATINGAKHAGTWGGTSASWEDLSLVLPGSWGDTQATAVWSDARTVRVVGFGRNLATNRNEALLWTRAICRADFNGAGGLNSADVVDFVEAWLAADPRADFNGVGGITVQDIFDFLNAWFAGC
jgi:hypothetical protein